MRLREFVSRISTWPTVGAPLDTVAAPTRMRSESGDGAARSRARPGVTLAQASCSPPESAQVRDLGTEELVGQLTQH
jgi:hypothetical protein